MKWETNLMNRRTVISATAAAAGFAVAPRWTLAQAAQPASPAASPAAGSEGLHEAMADLVDRGVAPGIVTLVAVGDEVVVDTLGAVAFDGGPMRRDTIFRIASMTKPITAVATLSLIEDGTLGIDDPVDRLLPELAHRRVLRRIDGPLDDTVPAERPISVRDLLTNRMGFGLVFEPDYPIVQAATEQVVTVVPPEPQAMPTPDEWLRQLGGLPLMFQPSTRWVYNTSSDVLGVLVARAAGRPFEQVLRERIFAPLGMVDTGFSLPPEKLGRLATSYLPDPSTGALTVFDGVEDSQWASPPPFPSGAAGLVSTVDDYLAFARMLLDGGVAGSGRILSAESVSQMTTDQLTPGQRATAGSILGEGRGWGYGVAVVTEPDAVSAVPGRYGWEGGYGSSWANDPFVGLTGILMSQSADMLTEGVGPFWDEVYRTFQAPP